MAFKERMHSAGRDVARYEVCKLDLFIVHKRTLKQPYLEWQIDQFSGLVFDCAVRLRRKSNTKAAFGASDPRKDPK